MVIMGVFRYSRENTNLKYIIRVIKNLLESSMSKRENQPHRNNTSDIYRL